MMSSSFAGCGVLLTAHGSVESLDDLPHFLSRIRRGRPVPVEVLEEVKRRYQAVGGSPFLALTRRVASRLTEQLRLPVFVGMRLSEPGLAEALHAARSGGVTDLAVVPLAPHSVHVYVEAVEQARAALSESLPRLRPVAPWGTEPGFVAAHVRALRAVTEGVNEPTEIVLSVHSLPVQVIRAGDPYTALVESSARAIADQLQLPVTVAFQSLGMDGGEWLQPSLSMALARAAERGVRRVIVDPLGFLCEHVETLYDLDIEARAIAERLGLGWVRVPALNDDPGFIDTLTNIAVRTLAGAAESQRHP